MEEKITSFLYYLEHIKGASNNTVQSYERDLKYLEIYLEQKGNMQIDHLKEADIEGYLSYLKEHQKSAATVSRTLAAIRAFYQYLIKENQLEDSFILLGKKINPYPYIKVCDLYVQPSRYEGKAVTVSEAKVLGKPILLTNYDTAHSQLEHNVDGYITDLSIDGIVMGIEKLYLDEKLRFKLADNCNKVTYGNANELEKIYDLI